MSNYDYDDEDENLPATRESRPLPLKALPAIPTISQEPELDEIKKQDLSYHQVILHNLNTGWNHCKSIKDLTALANATLKTLEHRRQMQLLPTKVEPQAKNQTLIFDPVD